MAKHTDLQVITNNAAALPALAQKLFADWKTFRLLMEQADYLADEYDTYGRISTSWKTTSQPATSRRRHQATI